MRPRNLSSLRADLHWSQSKLSKLVGCNRSVIINAEHPEDGCSIRVQSAIQIIEVLNQEHDRRGWEPVCFDMLTWRICGQDGKQLSLRDYCCGYCGRKPNYKNLEVLIKSSHLSYAQVARRANLSKRVIEKAAHPQTTIRGQTWRQIITAINDLRAENHQEPIHQDELPPKKITQKLPRPTSSIHKDVLMRA